MHNSIVPPNPSPPSRRELLRDGWAFCALGAAASCAPRDEHPRTDSAAPSADAQVDGLISETAAALRPPRRGELLYCGDLSKLARLPGLDESAAQAAAARAGAWITRVDALRSQNLSNGARETLDSLHWDLSQDISSARFYWNQFPLNPYTSVLNASGQIFGAASFDAPEDADRYRELSSGAAAYVDQITHKLRGQLARGILNHREQTAVVIQSLRAARTALDTTARLSPERLRRLDPSLAATLRADTDRMIDHDVKPAFDRLIGFMESEYAPRTTDNVRFDTHPNGANYYAWLVEMSSEQLDPAAAHEAAIADIARLDHELAEMRVHLGDTGADDADAFHRRLGRDPRWIAHDAAQIEGWFNNAIHKVEPHIPAYFRDLPSIPYSVQPVAPQYRAAVVNGTYIRATSGNLRGTYYYNPSDLETTSWLWAAPLIYHELLPGHHIQQSIQFQSPELSPYRRWLNLSGFTEGYAEYARRMCEGMGVYDDDPWSLYASRLLDRRFAIGVALDTGMQVRGWSADQAEAFFARDPLTKAAKRRQNVFTFACDIPGYATAYWRGGKVFDALKQSAASHQGAALNIRDYHYALLNGGCLPFDVLSARMRHRGFIA
jgi:uncharacterized protein (DUF885 family)